MFEQTFRAHRSVRVLRWPFALAVRGPLRALHAASAWVASSRGRPVRGAWVAGTELVLRLGRRARARREPPPPSLST
jgi:hypothetical protein